MNISKFIVLSICGVFLSAMSVFAGEWRSVTTYSYNSVDDEWSAPELTGGIWTLPNKPQFAPVQNKIKKAQLYIQLRYTDGLDNLVSLDSDPIAYIYNIKLRSSGNAILFSEIIDPVNSTGTEPENIYIVDVSEYADKIATVEFLVSTSSTNSYKNDAEFIVSLKYDFGVGIANEQTNAKISVGNPSVTLPTDGSRRVEFSWNSNFPFTQYDLEILRVYNNSTTDVGDDSFVPEELPYHANIDWSDALRVEVEVDCSAPDDDGIYDVSKKIALAESGYYLFRVRPIGDFYTDENNPFHRAENRNLGAWSSNVQNGQNQTINQTLITKGELFKFDDPAEDKNYTYQRVLTEQGNIHEVLSFANGLNQAVQTQTYLSSNSEAGKVLLTQSILDYSGRPTVTTLPVPLSGDLGDYRQGAKSDGENRNYTAADFDKGNKIGTPNPMTGDVSNYYSETDPNIPDAHGYPYTRVIYMNDGTNRVKEQSSPGVDHRIKHGLPEYEQHTVRYEYTQPSEDELVRIFGEEALPSSAVIKTITTDADGKQSISYTTNEGTVIATALAYDNVNESGASPFSINNRLTDDVFDGRSFYSQKDMFLPAGSELELIYNLQCDEEGISAGCFYATFAGSCLLSLDVELISQNTGDVYSLDNEQINSCDSYLLHKKNNWKLNGEQGIKFASIPSGKYTLTKRLTIGRDPEEEFPGMDVDPQEALEKVSKYLVKCLQNVNTEDDMQKFYLLIDALNTAIIDKTLNYENDNFLGVILDLEVKEFDIIASVQLDRNPAVSAPNNLIVRSGCCGDIKVPLNAELLDLTCPTIADEKKAVVTPEEKREFEKYSYKFISYLFSNALYGMKDENGQDIENQEAFDLVCPGYTPATLARMIYHMLTDTYQLNGQGDATVQYTCEEIWDSWKVHTNTLNDMLAQYRDMGQNDGNNMRKGNEEDDEGSKDEQDDESDDAFGDSPLMKFIMWFYDFDSPSSEMHDKEEDNPEIATLEVDYNFVEQFLNSVGYKFAKPITWIDNKPLAEDMPTTFQESSDITGSVRPAVELWDHYFGLYTADPVDNDYSAYPIVYECNRLDINGYTSRTMSAADVDVLTRNDGYANHQLYYEPTEGPFENTPHLVYPYIKSPVFAFKYFEYGTVMPVFDWISSGFDLRASAGAQTTTEWPRYTSIIKEKHQFDNEVARDNYQDPYTEFEDVKNKDYLFHYKYYPKSKFDAVNTDKKAEASPRWFMTEMGTCFINYENTLKDYGDPNPVLCDNPCGNKKGYEEWGNDELERFYKTISNISEETVPEINEAYSDAAKDMYSLTEDYLQTDLLAEAERIMGVCTERCSEKRNLMKQKLMEELRQNCYTIVDCLPEDADDQQYVITEEEIDELVDLLVADCQDQCNTLLENSNKSSCSQSVDANGDWVWADYCTYPKWTTASEATCHIMYPSGLFSGPGKGPLSPPKMDLFSECMWHLYDQIGLGTVELSLDNDDKWSGCQTQTNQPSWYGKTDGKCNGDVPVESEEADYSAERSVSIPVVD